MKKTPDMYLIPQAALERWRQQVEEDRPMRECIGRAFKSKYQKLGITRAELSRISGISTKTIAKFERGDYVRSWHIVQQSLKNAVKLKTYIMLLTAISRLQPHWLSKDC